MLRVLLKWLKKITILSIAPIGIYGTLELSRYYSTDVQYLPDDSFFTEFEDIKVDQFGWSARSGHGGIYWVSDNEIVTMAEIENEKALYLVNVTDGSYTKLVDTQSQKRKLRRYCFSNDTLFVSSWPSSEPLEFEYQPRNFKIVSRRGSELNGRLRSAVRCGYYSRPGKSKQRKGIRELLREDGFIVKLSSTGEKFDSVELVNADGVSYKELSSEPDVVNSINGTALYYPYFDGYFSYMTQYKPCPGVGVWWLGRKDWTLKVKDYCLGPWSKAGSSVIAPTNVGLFVEQHGSGKGAPWALYYLVTPEQELPIDMVGGRGV
ncbi:hypothetical protein, partial [Oleiphilus sp. HI0123]